MSAWKSLSQTQGGFADTILVRSQLLSSFREHAYRHAFVKDRVRSSIALQIRALRTQRNNMTQKELGDAIGMAQTWVSKLENPDYGKMTVATLLRLAEAFDTDIEIKFRPFSSTINTLPNQGPDYFRVASFQEEFGAQEDLSVEEEARLIPFIGPPKSQPIIGVTGAAATQTISSSQHEKIPRIPPCSEPGVATAQGLYGTR